MDKASQAQRLRSSMGSDRFILSEGHWTLDVHFVVDAGATVLIAGSSIYNEKGSVAQNVAVLR